MVSKVVPKGSQTSQTSILNPNWLPNAAQSDVLGIIFRRLWIVGALLSFLFLASLLGCWGSQWSYKRYYKAHGSSNAHATTAHYHQKNVRVGGMRRQPLKSAALFAYGQLTGVWGTSLSQSHPTLHKDLYTITVSTLFSLLMRASAKAQVTLVTKL